MRRVALFLLLAVLPGALLGQPAGGAGAHLMDGPVDADGGAVQIDWPRKLWRKNEAGSDGLGLCVYRSFCNAAIWHDEDCVGMFDWCKGRPGGSYPTKFAKDLAEYCRAHGLTPPPYVQLQTSDTPVPEALDLLAMALRNGHCVALTYSYSPTGRYGGQTISHMVNLVGARFGPQRLWAIMDNNFDSRFEAMSEQQFMRTWTGSNGGWAIIICTGGPPPAPRL